MPARIKHPDSDSLLGERKGVKLYALDFSEQYPLYRNLKLIAEAPVLAGRLRTAYTTWIVHQARIRRGGAAWRIAQHDPELMAWVAEICTDVFDRSYVADTLGITAAEVDALADIEGAKYAK